MKDKYNDAEWQSVRKTFAGEKHKLSQMTFQEKVDYILTYYKLHILAIILAVTFLIWGVHHAMTYVSYEFYGMVINSDNVDRSREEDIREYLKMGKHQGVNLSAEIYTDENANMSAYGNRLDIYVMAGQLDFAFTDEEGVKYLQDLEAIPADYKPVDIAGSPIQDYFGLDDNVHYLVLTGFSGNAQYMKDFQQMLDEIQAGKIK